MQRFSNSELINFFQSKIEKMNPTTAREYSKAVAHFASFQSPEEFSFANLSLSLLLDWLISMRMQAMTFKTAIHYLDIISALYKNAYEEEIVQRSDIFKECKAIAKEFDNNLWSAGIVSANLDSLIALFFRSFHLEPAKAVNIHLLLCALISGASPLGEIISLRKEELSSRPEDFQDLASRYLDPKRRFVFPLSQSATTPRKLEREIATAISAQLQKERVPIFGPVADTIASYWGYAALKSGVRASSVIKYFGSAPNGLPFLSLIQNSDEAPEISPEAQAEINTIFLSNSKRWYAMRLRRKVEEKDIRDRLKELCGQISTPELFYPTHTQARMEGKKIKMETSPVIPGIIFFRTRSTDVAPLFAKIGDLAWCYRLNSGAYAPISRESMRIFQQAVNSFTEDFEVGPIGSLEVRPGDKLKVLTGMFSGQTGELESIINSPEKGTIYSLKLTSDQGFEWRVTVDPRQTTPL